MRKARTYKGKSLALGGGGQFARLKDTLEKKGVRDPKALAATIGRKKLGAAKMASLAAKGRKRAARGRKKKRARLGAKARQAVGFN